MYPAFVSTSTKNEWNAQSAIWSRAFGRSITCNVCLDHLSRETYAKNSYGAKAFWTSIVVARTPKPLIITRLHIHALVKNDFISEHNL